VTRQFLTPVNRTTLTGDIYRKMVSHLLRGDWAPGEQIPPERELCQQLGVGRASLREALKALEIMGMIETRLGDGTYVCERSEFLSRPLLWAITSSSEADAQELVEARKLIEVELSGLAAERATSADLKQIGVHLDQMETSLHDVEQFLRSDIAFHVAVAQASHNNILMNALLLIRNLLQNWIGSTLRIAGVAERALEQHQRIFLAIAKNNPAAARFAMHTHLQEMANFLLASEKAEQTQTAAPSASIEDNLPAAPSVEKPAAKPGPDSTTSTATSSNPL
jgi:GntR family transcriptional regulator, transcriptional repressor for pyruvate dehydrogenase complex